ncbi:MAG: aminotransferase class I/II-fold pyridoxal phosphate-dependent enzyme [Christensenellales bacterium]
MDYLQAKKIISDSENKAKEIFATISETALYNQKKVLDAFREHRIGYVHFNPSTGYGYDDSGRDGLNKLYASVFKCDSALVSPLIANGTHALTIALFGLLRPGDVLFSAAGKPYDTLDDVINGKNNGSLKDYGVKYEQADLDDCGNPSIDNITAKLETVKPKIAFIQRSKGYLWREALSIAQIEEIITVIKRISPDTVIVVDNCYGEFVEKREPTEVGADVIVGSLIKNPGGGIAPTGGYIAGRSDCIEQISYRLTAPSLGNEVGSYSIGYRLFYQGLFLAPSTVKNALMGEVLASFVFDSIGLNTMPKSGSIPYDIICSIKFNTGDEMIKFCQSIQKVSPVDSYVTPEAWDMPGYNHPVVMAAGTFIQGASLELTADGTVREPFVAYMQGGLTYEHCVIALTEILKDIF